MKIKKVNIGTEEKPKITIIGDYWDNETMEKIIELLYEYSDLFPTTF
jgi:CTP:phosphocholine cytidylyltransferase-like protein